MGDKLPLNPSELLVQNASQRCRREGNLTIDAVKANTQLAYDQLELG